jgi:2-keto-4-pentenoate hydratase/2-oxohepta-3-ene-1,7-dioic acid hydratase in catechol pathway
MRLVTYGVGPEGPGRAGVRVGHRVLDVEAASRVNGEPLPASLAALFSAGRGAMARVQSLVRAATTQAGSFSHALHEERAVRLMPPLGDAGLVGHDATIAWPAAAAPLACQPQLVFVVGRRGLAVSREEALDCVAGVTILIALDGGGSPDPAGKGLPGFGALGPEIVTMDEIADPWGLWLSCSVNGEELLRASLHDPVGEMTGLLERASRQAPIEPGDLFGAAVPGGGDAIRLEPGDTVECSIEGVASLRAMIAAPGGA